MVDNLEYLDRQRAEVAALRAFYPEEGMISLDTLPLSEGLRDNAAQINKPISQSISGTALLPGVLQGNRPVGIHFRLPQRYPDLPPEVQILCEAGSVHVNSMRLESTVGNILLEILTGAFANCQLEMRKWRYQACSHTL